MTWWRRTLKLLRLVELRRQFNSHLRREVWTGYKICNLHVTQATFSHPWVRLCRPQQQLIDSSIQTQTSTVMHKGCISLYDTSDNPLLRQLPPSTTKPRSSFSYLTTCWILVKRARRAKQFHIKCVAIMYEGALANAANYKPTDVICFPRKWGDQGCCRSRLSWENWSLRHRHLPHSCNAGPVKVRETAIGYCMLCCLSPASLHFGPTTSTIYHWPSQRHNTATGILSKPAKFKAPEKWQRESAGAASTSGGCGPGQSEQRRQEARTKPPPLADTSSL